MNWVEVDLSGVEDTGKSCVMMVLIGVDEVWIPDDSLLNSEVDSADGWQAYSNQILTRTRNAMLRLGII
ncbi:MAG: hypothetical protein Kow0088_07420 [Anaerolineales bacterium]